MPGYVKVFLFDTLTFAAGKKECTMCDQTIDPALAWGGLETADTQHYFSCQCDTNKVQLKKSHTQLI